MRKHYFFLVLNTYTFVTRYEHGGYEGVEDIKNHLSADERLISVWEVGAKIY